MAFPSGKYTIINVYHENFACLPSSNNQEHIVGLTDPESTNHKWVLKAASQGRYSIQNVEFQGYMWVKSRPEKGEEIIAMSERKTWWKIHMQSDGNYWISPAGSTHLSWSLSEVDDETPIQLQSANADARCLWKIVPLQSETSATAASETVPGFHYQDLHVNDMQHGHIQDEDREDTFTEAPSGPSLLENQKNDTSVEVDQLGDLNSYKDGPSLIQNRHDDTFAQTNGLGDSNYAQNQYLDAEAAYKVALAGRRRTLGDTHQDTLRTWNSLAESLYAQNRYADAVATFKEILSVRRSAFGYQHKDALGTLNRLGDSNYAQGWYADAEAAYKEVLAGRRRTLGDQHDDTLRTWDSLAESLYAQSQYVDAVVEFREILAIRRRFLGDRHEGTLRTWEGLARSLYAQGRYTDAEATYKEIASVRRHDL